MVVVFKSERAIASHFLRPTFHFLRSKPVTRQRYNKRWALTVVASGRSQVGRCAVMADGKMDNPSQKGEEEEAASVESAEHHGDVEVSAGSTSQDATRIQQTFARVMQKVKQTYHKELQRKKQVDLTSSVDIMRTRNPDELTENEPNEDDEAMQAMAKEIEVTRRLLEVSEQREEQSKQTIAQLEAEVSKLQKLVEEEEALRRDEGLTLHQLVTLKKQLTADNEKLTGENQVYSQQFVLLQTELQEATGDKKRLDLRLAHLQNELLALRESLDAETQASVQVREERDAIQREFELRQEDIEKLRKELETVRTDNASLAVKQAQLEIQNRKLEQVSAGLSGQFENLTKELDAAKRSLANFDDENSMLSEQLRLANAQIQDRLKDIGDLEMYQKNALLQIDYYDKECRKAETERDFLDKQLEKLEKELGLVRKAATVDRQGNDKVVRENRQLHVQLHEHMIAREKQGDVWQIQQETIRRMEGVLRDNQNQMARLRAKLIEAQQDTSRLLAERNGLRREYRNIMEKVVVNEREITRLNESHSTLEKKIQQHQVAESATKQIKVLIDSEMAKLKEINSELEKRVKTLAYMEEKLKEELSTKEALLMQAKRVKEQMEGEMAGMKRLIEANKSLAIDSKANEQQHQKQIHKLQVVIQQTKSELSESLIQIQAEKTSNSNIEQKCSELRAQLEETRFRVREQERVIQTLTAANKRLESESRLVREEIERIDQEKKAMAQRVHATSGLHRDYELLRESLLQEQARRSALEVEKRTPVLVHPWRILQASDPTTYVKMMRDQSAKRHKIFTKGKTKLPEVNTRRPISSGLNKRGPPSELQIALIKAIV